MGLPLLNNLAHISPTYTYNLFIVTNTVVSVHEPKEAFGNIRSANEEEHLNYRLPSISEYLKPIRSCTIVLIQNFPRIGPENIYFIIPDKYCICVQLLHFSQT